MKKLILIILFLLAISVQLIEAQDSTKNITLNEKSDIRDSEGNKVEYQKAIKMMMSGDWTLSPETSKDGNTYFQVRKNTEEEKIKMKEMIKKQMGHSDFSGKEVPDFNLTDINGNIISSESTKGKIVVLNFWFIACKPCVAEIPELNEVYNHFKDNDDIIFASITFDSEDKVETFTQKKPINYPLVTDSRNAIKEFGVSAYPTNMVIGKDGKIVEAIVGGFPEIGSSIKEMIEKALKTK